MAKKAGNCHTIARIKSPDYAQDTAYLRSELGLAMVINPEYMAAKEITRILSFPSAINVETFSRGRVELLKFRLPEGSPLVGQSLRDAMIRLKVNVLVCTVEREDGAFIPKGDFIFAEKDVVSIIASAKSAKEFFEKIGYALDPIRDAVIIGGGTMTHYLCEMLEKSGVQVKIIEKDKALCESLAVRFDDVTVIQGDPTKEDVLREERVTESGAFIALTNLDEENILLSLFAKNEGSPKIITKINRIEYNDVISRLDLDSIIYPKNITTGMIVRYVRATANSSGSNMETLYHLIKGEVEVSEFTVKEGCPLIGKPISELSFKDDVLIAAILRGRQLIIPRGKAIIEAGDSVVIVAKLLAITDISDVLQK